MMEILRAAGERGTGGIPAHHHNVEEWSNLDPYGGIREHKRVETDHWANKTRNSSHQYGKVVDSRARNLADGSREQLKQMKQLEVFQARVPGGGSVQVIRSHTSTTSSKTSGHSWTNSKMIDTSTPVFEPSMDFDNLKLSIMPLNLNSEKSRISLGRSGSMNKRRPPTRPRSLLCSDDTSETILPVAAAPAEPEPKPQPTKQPEPKIKLAELSSNSDRIGTRYTTPSVRFIKSEIGKSAERQKASEKSTTAPYKSPTIVRNESLKSPKIFRSLIGNKKGPVNLPDVEKASEHEHRPLEAKKSVSSEDVSQDYEGYGGDPNLQRSSAARRSLNLHKDYHWSSQHTNELENVFKKVLKNKTFYNQTAFNDDDLTRETVEDHNEPFSNAPVKKSFVSVETIKNIRNNLKPVEDVGVKAETEEREAVKLVLDVNGESDRVKNYNTGSLETRQTRNEEWYNRRKSYGFEQMKETNDPQHSSGQSLKNIESSTDSGIAKSNENIDSLVRKGIVNPSNDLFEVRRNSLSKSSKIYTALMSLRDSNKKSDFENPSNSQYEISTDKNGESKVRDLTSNAEFNDYSQSLKDTQNEPLTITIKPKEEHTSVVSIPNNNEMKVESTMTDDGEFFRKVKEIYDKGAWADDKNGDNKKTKKVEFSKTEVHFEPGKVNIIETNEKPPPINYRRRKKDRVAKNAERAERNAVKLDKHKDHFPETKFGDEMKQSPVIALPYETKEQIAHDQPTETNIEIIVDETSEDESKRPKSILKAGKIEETTNENVDQTRTDFQKILNSFKTCERQNTTSPPIVDSGLKVRISSGNNQFDQRRASWCVPETGNKFSTKINFGADNITVLPQKTRYSYCEPSERTIQSLVSQSGTVNDATEERNKIDSFEGHPVSQSNTVCNNEFSRFRTKSPLSSVTKTFLNSEPVVSYNGFVPKSDETMKVLEALRTNGDVPKEIEPKILETVQRRNPEGRSSDLSSSILNRYSFTESSESPVMSKRSQKPARYSYVEPTSTSSTSTAEPIWYQQGRPDIGKVNCPDRDIVRIGLKNYKSEKWRSNLNGPFSLKQILNESKTNKDINFKDDLNSETNSPKTNSFKSTRLVLQANEKSVNCIPNNTSQNNPSNALKPCDIVGCKNIIFEEKERSEINSSTFLENVVAKPIESIIHRAPSCNESSFTNNLRPPSNIFKSNSFPTSSKITTNSTFPSYRKSYLIAIGAENEIQYHANTKTYPWKKDKNEINVKLLEMNKELPPRSPSKQFLSISFDNILDGRLLKNNDLTEPSPLIVPLNQSKAFLNDESIQSSHIEKKLTEKSSACIVSRPSRNNVKKVKNTKCPPNFHAPNRRNRISFSSDSSTESSLIFESNKKANIQSLNAGVLTPHHILFDNRTNHYVVNSLHENSHNEDIEIVRNDLIPSVLSDLDNLSKSIDEEIFDIPNKVKRRPSILDDDIYCLEINEKDSSVKRRHKNCYKCNYDKDNENIDRESKYSKRIPNTNVKTKINLLKLKSDEEYRKKSIKDILPTVIDIGDPENKIKCKKKENIKKIKSIEDLKINKLINTLNKNVSAYSLKPSSDSNSSTANLFSQKHETNFLKTVENELELELDNVTLSNELERLTNEFKKNISTTNTLNSVNSNLNKLLSENEIYDLMHSEKLTNHSLENNSESVGTKVSVDLLENALDSIESGDSSVSQTRCDTFRHDFNNSKFKLINAKSSKLICDTPAYKKSSLRSKLLRNHKPSPFSLTTDDGELSDDSLKADEEVRNLLRQTEERNNTNIQQWNGGVNSHSITTNESITTITPNTTNNQISTASTNNIKGKEQNLNSHSGNTTKAESKKTTDAVRVTSISLHYEPKPAKAKTFQPVCLIYKPESLTNKNYEDPQHVLENEIETTNVTSRSCHSKTKTSVQENIKEVKGPSREPKSSDQKRITNELKQINDYINLSSSKTAEKSTRRSDRLVKDETPKRPARKIKEEPIYERIKIRSKKEIPAEKDPIRAKNTREHASVKSSGRDGWLNIPKDNVHASRSKDSKVRSRDSSVESNHTITNRSRTSSVNSNIRSRTSSLESNSQLHSAVLLRSRKDDIEQRSRTSSIDSNRSTNLRNSSRINSNNSTPVRSRTSSIESNRSYQGISKPKPDAQKSRLTTAIQTRRSTISQTRESRTKPVITENRRCTKQLLESANRGICPKEISSKSKQYQSHTVASRSRNSSADSTIMEELTKAADEILLAVNGYTDEDSIRGSDDERKRRKSYKPLSTISEAPNKVDSSKRSRKLEASVIVRENVYSNVKNQRRSSNSSLENNEKASREPKPKAQENIYANIKTVKQSSSNEKIAKKKAARMQRSSSREILASSSDEEDNLNDLKNKKPVRRSKGKSNSLEVSQDKKCDKTDKTPQRKPRSSSMIRSVANHIIDTVSPVLTADKTNSTDKKSSLKNVLFSKHSINGLKSSSMQKDIKSSPAQNPKSSNTKTSSSVKKK